MTFLKLTTAPHLVMLSEGGTKSKMPCCHKSVARMAQPYTLCQYWKNYPTALDGHLAINTSGC